MEFDIVDLVGRTSNALAVLEERSFFRTLNAGVHVGVVEFVEDARSASAGGVVPVVRRSAADAVLVVPVRSDSGADALGLGLIEVLV